MRRRGGLSAATAGVAELVAILGGPGDLSDAGLRSLYMASIGAAVASAGGSDQRDSARAASHVTKVGMRER